MFRTFELPQVGYGPQPGHSPSSGVPVITGGRFFFKVAMRSVVELSEEQTDARRKESFKQTRTDRADNLE